jgi:hypothetical protein
MRLWFDGGIAVIAACGNQRDSPPPAPTVDLSAPWVDLAKPVQTIRLRIRFQLN